MTPLLVLALLSVAAAAPDGYNYEAPKCKIEYPTTVVEKQYKTNLKTEYSTRVVPEYKTKYVTRTKVVPSYVYRTVLRTEYVPKTVVQSATSTYVRDQVVTSQVQLPDQYITNNVYKTITRYVTRTQVRQVVKTAYQPTTIYREAVSTAYVRSTVEVPRYVTTTITQRVPGPASTAYRTDYVTSTYVSTVVLPAETVYVTKTQTKVNEIVKTQYLPAVTVTATKTDVVYQTKVVTDVRLSSRYTTVAVPVYYTNTRVQPLVKTNYVTSNNVQYTTVTQAQTKYEQSTRYVPKTQYEEATQVVTVKDAPRTEYRTVPVYVTSTVQLPDTYTTVYRTKTVQRPVQKVVSVTRPEYRETTVTQTVEGKCGYSYPEPTVQLQYGK
ncbi:uncharacterized protein LOC122366919 isoform X1 [Amphibalanus amphitrite]|nr:uncharacterized protein LOC122366919 isoform X1 [Amphibalanus amphitrite]